MCCCLFDFSFWQTVAFIFFYLGLDQKRDQYRAFHGLWHSFTGLASIYHWRVIVSHRERTDIADTVKRTV